MQISMEWLSDFLDLSQTNGQELANLMSVTGIEVEKVFNYGDGLSNLVVGHVIDCQPHPNSDHLKVCQVDIGDKTTQIVCGAPNVALGQKVIVALPGAILPGDFKIKPTQLRGQDSNGMICSLQELGFSDNIVPKHATDGIYILEEDAPVGADIIDYLKLNDDILETDITPNRADALSMRGVAYEVGAILNQTPVFDFIEVYPVEKESSLLDIVSVSATQQGLTSHYQLRVIDNITVKPSPVWLQIRLMKAGIRPINNIVDVTNYYLLLYGQPMHAFDYDAVSSQEVLVTLAEEGQVFTTLDDNERILSNQDVLIKTGNQISAMAGVMGGLDSEVTDSTKRVLLETAVFSPEKVRLTSKRHGLRSESSMRFEKGINPATVNESGQQAAALMALLGDGVVVEGVKEYQEQKAQSVEVTIAYDSIPNKIGVAMDKETIFDIINRLGFEVDFAEETFKVTVPPRRWDITIEADILEEIARIYGYDRIPASLPAGEMTLGQLTVKQQFVRRLRRLSEAAGLNQVVTYVLTSFEGAKLLSDSEADFVKLLMPMSEERVILRQSMLPAMLEVANYNQARQINQLAFYEIGRVFYSRGSGQLPLEKERFSILLSGVKQPATWLNKAESYDFFDIKGVCEQILNQLNLDVEITYQATDQIDVMHPGRTAYILFDQEIVGLVGQIHPLVADKFDLNSSTFYLEIDLDLMVEHMGTDIIQQVIPRYPSSSRDISFLVNDTVSHADLVGTIKANGGAYLQSVHLFDLYQGEHIEAGKKSMAYHLVFLNPLETLKDKQIDAIMEQVTQALEDKYQAIIR